MASTAWLVGGCVLLAVLLAQFLQFAVGPEASLGALLIAGVGCLLVHSYQSAGARQVA